MDNLEALGARLVNAFRVAGVEPAVIGRLCETLEAGQQVQLEREAASLRDKPINTKQPGLKQAVEYWELSTLGTLRMYSEIDLHNLPGITKQMVTALQKILKGFGHSLRDHEASVAERAKEVFGSVANLPVPIAVHMQLSWLVNQGTNRKLMGQKGWWNNTIQVFNFVTRAELLEHFEADGVVSKALLGESSSTPGHRFVEFLETLGIELDTRA